jgi:hypothetical protein
MQLECLRWTSCRLKYISLNIPLVNKCITKKYHLR